MFWHRMEWSDGLFDVAWSEEHENHVVTSSGDGSLQLWDLGLRPRVKGPVRHYKVPSTLEQEKKKKEETKKNRGEPEKKKQKRRK